MSSQNQGQDCDAWLLLCAGDDREHGGNDGYADQPDTSYLWGSTVGNATKVKSGDKVVLGDKKVLSGASVVERIEVVSEQKNTYKCPVCNLAGIS